MALKAGSANTASDVENQSYMYIQSYGNNIKAVYWIKYACKKIEYIVENNMNEQYADGGEGSLSFYLSLPILYHTTNKRKYCGRINFIKINFAPEYLKLPEYRQKL